MEWYGRVGAVLLLYSLASTITLVGVYGAPFQWPIPALLFWITGLAVACIWVAGFIQMTARSR